MKKVLSLAFVLVISLILAACGGNGSSTSKASPQVNMQSAAPIESKPAETKAQNTQTETVENNSGDKRTTGGNTVSNSSDVRIKMTFTNDEVIVKMHDNPTSRDFLMLLPLTLTLKDYAGTEKISYLSRKLSTEDAPSGIDPSVGDFTYYSPWGNLAVFYKDFGYSNDLIKLGKIESGIEKLAYINGDFTVKIEIAGP